MSAFEGPYVHMPRESGGFVIQRVGNLFPIALVPAVGFVATNRDGRKIVEDTARLLAAAPMLLKSLEVLAAAPDLDPDLLAIALHAIDVATKAR